MWWIVLGVLAVFLLLLFYSMLVVSARAEKQAAKWEQELRDEQNDDLRDAA